MAKYVLFSGRVNRLTYIIGSLLWFIIFILFAKISFSNAAFLNNPTYPYILFGFGLILLVYNYSLMTKRYNDIGKGDYNKLYKDNFFKIPRLDLWFQEGEIKNNKYGTKPRNGIDLKALIIP